MSNISLTIHKQGQTNKQPESKVVNLPTIPINTIVNASKYKGQERLINNNFTRPPITYQDSIQNNKDMEKYLKNYVQVYDIDSVPLGTHLRYITLDKNKKNAFRLGGNLIRKEDKYVVLSNGKQCWSVQKVHYFDNGDEPLETVFFRTVNKMDRLISMVNKQEIKIRRLTQICKGLCEHLNIDIEYNDTNDSDIDTNSELTDASEYTSESEYSDYTDTSSQ